MTEKNRIISEDHFSAISKSKIMDTNKYSQLDDFNINKLVAERFGLQPTIKALGGSGNAVCVKDNNYYKFEPCHDPSHAWPIITFLFENNITLAMNGSGVLTGNLGVKYQGKSLDIEDNPLRAAMIVYLVFTDPSFD